MYESRNIFIFIRKITFESTELLSFENQKPLD